VPELREARGQGAIAAADFENPRPPARQARPGEDERFRERDLGGIGERSRLAAQIPVILSSCSG
jgi:hypothetical protein